MQSLMGETPKTALHQEAITLYMAIALLKNPYYLNKTICFKLCGIDTLQGS